MPHRSSSAAVLLATGLLAALPAATPLRAQQHQTRELEYGTFQSKTFASKSLDGPSVYGVYLPEGYDDEANADRRYPLIIWLHGMFEDHMRFHVRGGTAVLDQLIGSGDLPELILVTAEGGIRSFYINGVKSGAYEDLITKDLLPHIESTYRVQPGPDHRALLGVSMGGYGALKIAFKNPRLFGAVGAHSAALMPRDPGELDQRFPWLKRWGGGQKALGEIFGDPIDRQMWDAENVLTIADGLEPGSLSGLKIYMDCGDEDRYGFEVPNLELHEVLEARKVPHTWRLVAGGNHGWRSHYNQEAIPHSLAFVAAAWATRAGVGGLQGLLHPGKKGQ